MRNLGILLLISVFFSFPVWAEEKVEAQSAVSENIVAAENTDSQENSQVEAEDRSDSINIVITGNNNPEEVFKDEKVFMPSCNSEKLIVGILEKIRNYQQKNPSAMQIDKRKDALLLKNLTSFSDIPVENFTSKNDFNVANRIIMTKINKGIPEEEIRLCKSNGHGKAGEIYAMLYPVGDGYIVDIINFIPETADNKTFSFIYTE